MNLVRVRRIFDTKLFLWCLFLIQLLLIGIFIIFGSFIINANTDEGLLTNGTVKFVKGVGEHLRNQLTPKILQTPHFLKISPISSFDDYYRILPLPKNGSGNTQHVCYRHGSQNQTNTEYSCICKPEWHGTDCGQPEIMWRAFMTSKYPLNLSSATRHHPHNVYYIIQTTALSLETLEIQMMEVVDIVNLFILCDLIDSRHYRSNNSFSSNRSRLPVGYDDEATDRLFKHHKETSFLKSIRHKLVLINDSKCTARNVYQKFRKLLHPNDYRKEDILIFSKSEEILNRKAINYFRWYDNWPQPVKFRLKWLVYGFFWQYPENTCIGSVVSQLGILEEVYKSDPSRMFDAKPAIIVGDLNHFGGWYCQYCAQILDIIKKLQYDKSSISTASYQLTVNTEYIQNLIATGLYVNGKIGLIKLRRYSDKYYSPEYVTKFSWKFDNIVINLFAKWEEDDYENSWK